MTILNLLHFTSQISPSNLDTDLTKLGVIGALLLLIVWMIKYFVSAIERTQAAQSTSVKEISVAVTSMGDRLANSDQNLASAIQDLRIATIQQAASNIGLREIVLLQRPDAQLTSDQLEQLANRVVTRLKD